MKHRSNNVDKEIIWILFCAFWLHLTEKWINCSSLGRFLHDFSKTMKSFSPFFDFSIGLIVILNRNRSNHSKLSDPNESITGTLFLWFSTLTHSNKFKIIPNQISPYYLHIEIENHKLNVLSICVKMFWITAKICGYRLHIQIFVETINRCMCKIACVIVYFTFNLLCTCILPRGYIDFKSMLMRANIFYRDFEINPNGKQSISR